MIVGKKKRWFQFTTDFQLSVMFTFICESLVSFIYALFPVKVTNKLKKIDKLIKKIDLIQSNIVQGWQIITPQQSGAVKHGTTGQIQRGDRSRLLNGACCPFVYMYDIMFGESEFSLAKANGGLKCKCEW